MNSPSDAPSDINFPYGMFSFTITGVPVGNSVTMRLFIPKDQEITGYWKKNKTTGRWDNIATSIEHGPSYASNKTVISFELVDGGPYDEDELADGNITDEGGPGKNKETGMIGDVNGDGGINIVDALLVARYAVNLPVSNFDESAVDVNCDGQVNIIDALFIARKAVSLPVNGWCGE